MLLTHRHLQCRKHALISNGNPIVFLRCPKYLSKELFKRARTG